MTLEPDRVGGRLLRPVATLLSGSGLAFLIGYAAKPVILRLFDAEAFGVYEFVIALVAVGLPVASLRYEDAVVLPESDTEARDVWVLSALLTLVSTVLATAAVVLLGHLAPEPVRPWLWTVPALLLILRFSKLAELWLTRRKIFGTISGGGVAQSVAGTSGRIGFGVAGAGAGGLLSGFAIGHITGLLVYAVPALRSMPPWRGSKPRSAARRYVRFARYSSPAALVSALATRLPALVLIGMFGAEVLGWFSQAFNVLFVPLSLAGTAVGHVFFVRAAEAQREGSLREESLQAHGLLASAAVVPVAGFCAAGPAIFSFVFGADWQTAGSYAVLMAPWIMLSAIGSPLTRIFDVTERQRTDLTVNLVQLALMAGTLVVFRDSQDPLMAIAALGAAGVLGRLVQIGTALQVAGISLRDSVLPYFRPAAEGLLLFGAVRLAQHLGGPPGATLTIAAGLLVWLPLLIRRHATHV